MMHGWDVRLQQAVIVPHARVAYAGFTCDDFSMCNTHWGSNTASLNRKEGKSSKAFEELLGYLEVSDVAIFFGENVVALVGAVGVA